MPRVTAVERVPVAEYAGTYPGQPCQVQHARRGVQQLLAGHQAEQEAVLIASELVTNAILHSGSKDSTFTIRAEVHDAYVWIEVEDAGGQWAVKGADDRMHGLALVEMLTGPDNWGVDGGQSGRVVWARVATP
jgi:anti-sigma regulatory factor (Ser/Thr protein kinase)